VIDCGFTAKCALCGAEIYPQTKRLIYMAEGMFTKVEDIHEFCVKHLDTASLDKRLKELIPNGEEDYLENSKVTVI